jgi:hypothetical protein
VISSSPLHRPRAALNSDRGRPAGGTRHGFSPLPGCKGSWLSEWPTRQPGNSAPRDGSVLPSCPRAELPNCHRQGRSQHGPATVSGERSRRMPLSSNEGNSAIWRLGNWGEG